MKTTRLSRIAMPVFVVATILLTVVSQLGWNTSLARADFGNPPVITEGDSVSVSMSENGLPNPFDLTLHATGGTGPLTWDISDPASHGTASVSGTGSPIIVGYTPTADYSGTDTFEVLVDDGDGGTDTITVNVTIYQMVQITWWHISTDNVQRALWQTLADEYMAAHPNVDIQISVMENNPFKSNLASAMQAGNPPDIFQSWGGGQMNDYANAGLLQDITPALDANANAWRNTFAPGPLSVYSYLGENYGVPWDMGMVGFWYNKDLFSLAGISAPPTTWSELLVDVNALKTAGITPISIGEGDKWPGALWWEYLATRIGGQVAFEAAYNHTGAFTDLPFIEAGTKLQDLVDLLPFQNGFLGTSYWDESAIMGNGQAAMELMGQWAPSVEAASSNTGLGIGDKLGFFPFPTVVGGAGAATDVLGGGNGFAIGKNAPPEAIDFVKYLTRAESQVQCAAISMCLPVVEGGEAGLTDPLLIQVQQYMVDADYFQLYYDQYLPPYMGDAVNDSVYGIFAGSLTPQQSAEAIENAAPIPYRIKMEVTDNSILDSGTSTITATVLDRYDTAVADGTEVDFSVISGGSVDVVTGTTVDGKVTTTFTGSTSTCALAEIQAVSGSVWGTTYVNVGASGPVDIAGSNITTDTTWGAACTGPYLVHGDVNVQPGTTLTVEPGTQVRFDNNIGLYILGSLDAIGSNDARIVFTADNNSPSNDMWTGLTLGDADNAVSGDIEYITIAYAGQGHHWVDNDYTAGLLVYRGEPEISYSLFLQNGGQALWAAYGSGPSIHDNTILYSQGNGLVMESSFMHATETLIPAGQRQDVNWNYTVNTPPGDPGVGWNDNLGFDDSVWSTGSTPICDYDGCKTFIDLEGDTVFARKVITIPGPLTGPYYLRVIQDDESMVWINGTQVYNQGCCSWGPYVDVTSALQIGDNLVAVSVNDGGMGGNNFDLELLTGTEQHPFVENNRIEKNGYNGSPAVYINDSSPVLRGNVIDQNQANGIRIENGSTPTIQNSLIYSNRGDGVSFSESSPSFVNNTVDGNRYTGIYWDGGSSNPVIENNIVSSNGGGGINCGSSTFDVSYNDAWNNPGNFINCDPGAAGNISREPLYLDPDNGDYHLQLGSPAIDAGNPDPAYNDPPPPLGGTRNDMGAYGGEYGETYTYEDVHGPVVEDGAADPGVVVPGNDVTLTARIWDPSGVYSAQADIESPDENVIISLAMYDDGTNGDVTASDGIYTAIWTTLSGEATYLVDIEAQDNDSPTPLTSNYGNVITFQTHTPVAFVVDTTANSGAGSLRQAMLDAQPSDTISFDTGVFPPGSPATIDLASALPSLSQGSLTIDASNAGVILDGSGLPGGTCGLDIISFNNVVKGLQILHFPASGICIHENAQSNIIGGSRLVGDGPTGEGNVLSGNAEHGLFIHDVSAAYNIALGNFIGLETDGVTALPNGDEGVTLWFATQHNTIGGTASGEANVISGNSSNGVGITNADYGNIIAGNIIGLDVTGSFAVPNQGSGISLGSGGWDNQAPHDTLIGGSTPGERNVIGGNRDNGISISQATDSIVSGNYIGTDVTGQIALPNAGSGIQLQSGATGNVIGGDSTAERNVIFANRNAGVGISDPDTATNTVRGNYIGLGLGPVRQAFTSDLAVSPAYASDHTVYAATLTSGVHKSTDSGATWSEVNTGLTEMRLLQVLIPTDATDADTVYALAENGDLFTTANGGGTWSLVSTTLEGIDRRNLVLSATFTSDSTMYASSENWSWNELGNSGNPGVFKSTDGGVTWAAVVNGMTNQNIWKVFVSPDADEPDTLFAITRGDIQKSTDGGANWAPITTPDSNLSGMAISPDYATDHTLVLAAQNGPGRVYFSTDGGASWSEADALRGDLRFPAISPNFSIDQLVAHGGGWNDRFYSTTNFGSTWSENETQLPAPLNDRGEAIHFSPNFAADSTIFMISYSGISKSTDGGATWTFLRGFHDMGNTTGVQLSNNTHNNSVLSNVISNNDLGITLDNDYVANNIIAGNFIGTTPDGMSALGNTEHAVAIWGGHDNMIGGDEDAERNIIAGSVSAGSVWLNGPNVEYNTVSGNFIGLDATGLAILGNGNDGVGIMNGANHNVIGGDTPAKGNVIGGSGGNGVGIWDNGTDYNTISHNYIGVNAAGTAAFTNRGSGVGIWSDVSNTTISDNLISGNDNNGVDIHDGNITNSTISGNTIGLNAAGTAAIPNRGQGVSLRNGASLNTISNNLIGSNNGDGISLSDGNTMDNTVNGNYIGTDITGLLAMPNGNNGVQISNDSYNNMIGGTTPGERNIIFSNQNAGVNISGTSTTNNTVQGNYIGLGLGPIRQAFTSSLAVSPDYEHDCTLYAATVTTGVHKSTDCGDAWVEVNSGLTQTRLLQILIPPDATDAETVYVMAENGDLFETDDGGDSWSLVSTFLEGIDRRNLVLSATFTSDQTMYASAENWSWWDRGNSGNPGVFKSEDGGVNWLPVVTDMTNLNVWKVVASPDPLEPDTLFAITRGDIQKSIDGGDHWTAITPPDGNLSGLALSPDYHNDQTLMVTAQTGPGRVYFSTEGGATWSGTDTNRGDVRFPTFSPNYSSDDLAVHGGGWNDYFHFTTDSGAHWNNRNTQLPGPVNDRIETILFSPNFAADDTIFIISNGGISKSVDGGDSWALLSGFHTPGNGPGVQLNNGAHSNFILDNVISNNVNGVTLNDGGTSNNIVAGNLIGTLPDGVTAAGNIENGVQFNNNASGNTIGGDSAAERNVISGNINSGVSLNHAANNTVSGNYIGLDLTGQVILSNGNDGVDMSNGSSGNVIGGATDAERNLISGNGNGVGIWDNGSQNNTISHNYIGTNVTGQVALPNRNYGVMLNNNAASNLISDNLISGNNGNGVELHDGDVNNNTVSGNTIGLNVDGTAALSNGGSGVSLWNGANHNAISDNLIGGNSSNGLDIRDGNSTDNTVSGNTISGNQNSGIQISNNSIRNTLSQNSIYDNGNQGIDLNNNGNNELPAPLVTAFDLGFGTASGTACPGCTVEIFSDVDGEGRTYEGTTTADGSGDWNFIGSPMAGPHITTTATDTTTGNTSEFSVVLFVRVNLTHNWVQGDATPGSTITATIQRAGGPDLPCGVGDNGMGGGTWWQINCGNQMQVNDIIYVESAMGAIPGQSASVAIIPMTGEVDPGADTISGQITGVSFPAHIRAEVWGASGGPTVEGWTDSSGNYSLDLHVGSFDLLPGHMVGLWYVQPDSNMVAIVRHGLQLRVDTGRDVVDGSSTPGASVTITVTGGETHSTIVTDPNGNFSLDFDHDIVIGDTVSGSTSTVSTSLVVADVSLNLDPGVKVWGYAPANSNINVASNGWWQWTSTNGSGYYEVNFGGGAPDGAVIGAQYNYPEGHQTSYRSGPPDLSINKNGPSDPVAAGFDYVYTISYSSDYNQGAATNVVITDTLPDHVSYVSDTSGVTPDIVGNVVTWDMGHMGYGRNGSFDVHVFVDHLDEPTDGLTLTNHVEISATGETNLSNNSSDSNVSVFGHRPVANIQPSSQPVVTGQTVTLDGTGSSDPDGNPITYLWSQTDGTPVSISDPTASSITFTAPGTGSGLTFNLTVTDSVDLASETPAEATVSVGPAETTTTITSDSPDDSVVGQSVTVNFTVAVNSPGSGTPTGSVSVGDGVDSCSGTISAGTCDITLTTLGGRTLTATYVGDANFNGSIGTEDHTVNKADTTTTITSDSPDASVVGQSVTVDFTVAVNSPGSGTPTGSVSVSDGVDSCSGTIAAGTCDITLTTLGSRTLTATYVGDAKFNGSSDTEDHTVNKAETTTTITSDSPDASVVGQSVTVNFTVAVNPPGSGTPSGNVNITTGGGPTCNAALGGGSGNCDLTFTSAGPVTITATYAGDTKFNGSSDTENHTVNKAETTTTITSDSPDASVVGQSVTVNFTVGASLPGSGTPTGTVIVSDGVNSCSDSVSTGTCTITLTTLGSRTLAAIYAGDTNFNGSSDTENHTVNQAGTTTTITSDASDPSVVGEGVVVNYTVTVNSPGSGTPTGNVTVGDGVNSCTGTVGAGTCTITLTTLGSRTLTATYAGDAKFTGSSDTEEHTVNQAGTTTTITSDASDPSVVGEAVVVNYTVTVNSPGSGTPTGNVTVGDGVNSCTGTVGAGTCTITLTTLGSRTLTATYAGDAKFTGSSDTEEHTVNQAGTTTTITSDASDPSVVGEAVVVNYTVTVNSPGSGTPTGNVTVGDGVNSCTGTVGAGTCTITLTTLGSRTLAAIYAGDTNFNGSSDTENHTVNQAGTTTTITSDASDPSVVGEAVVVNYTVTVNSPGSGTPTGNVTVGDGVNSCTGTVGAGTCTITLTTLGSRTLTATYAGDAKFTGSSDTEEHTVNQAGTTTTITTDNPDASAVGQSVTVNFTVAVSSPGSGTPTGNVNITTGGGPTCSAALSGGSGSCDLTFNSAGPATITATYAGDTKFNSSSDTEGHTVNKANSNVTVWPTASAITYGQTLASSTLSGGTATPSGGSFAFTTPSTAPNAGTASQSVTYTPPDTDNYNISTGSVSVTVNKADTTTTITSDSPDVSVVGQSVTVNFTVTVNSPGSGTPTGSVNVSDGVDSCSGTISAGTCTIALTTQGSRTLTATYAGDANFNGSSDTEEHTVNKADTTITITSDNPDASVVGQSVTVSFTVAVVSPGSGTPSGNVNITTGGGPTCSAALSGGSGSCGLTFTSAGPVTITATYAGDTKFNSSSDTEGHTVNKANSNVTTWPTASAISYGQTLASSILSGGIATPDGTFAFTTPGTAPNAGTASHSVTFTPNDPDNYNSAIGAASVTVNKAVPSITTWPTASAITYGQTLASSILSGGIATPAGTFAFTTPATAPDAGTASQSVTFTPGDTANYNTATGTVSVTVNKAAQAITFGALADKVLGDADFNVSAFTSSGLVVSFTTTTTSVCTISAGGTVHLVATGTCTITAYQNGNSNYNSATDVPQSFNVGAPVNHAPVISEGASVDVSMSQDGSPSPFNLNLHATDADGDIITWSILTPAGHGTALASGTGTSKAITYTPVLHYVGSDTFIVQVSDGNGGTDTIIVNVTITAVAPTTFTIHLPLILR